MTLKLADNLKLPADAATETFAILGRRGSGKTHTAVVMAEEMLGAGVQVIVIDPLDVWYGLRVSKDGKSAGIPIYVAGGAHADIPLVADAGKVLADVVVDKGLSMVLSLRHLSKADQRRFVGDFGERLYDRKGEDRHRTAIHVFIDEADAFVPQRLMPGSERCFGAIDTLVRRGRSSGIAPTLISQRPQVINKDVLSQTEVLVAHQLTGPQDRKALEAWIESHDTENQQATFMASLASLPKGTAWFWSPGLLNIFTKIVVRDRRTFDSSATPKPGAAAAKPKAFATVDLEAITAEVKATIEQAKADDPRELRAQLKQAQAGEMKAERICEEVAEALGMHDRTYVPGALATGVRAIKSGGKRVEVLTDGDRALLEKLVTGLRERALRADEVLTAETRLDRLVQAAVAEYLNTTRTVATEVAADVAKTLERAGFQKILTKLEGLVAPAPPRPIVQTRASYAPERTKPIGQVVRNVDERIKAAAARMRGDGAGDASVGKAGLRRMLIALAQRPQGLTRSQLGLRARVSVKGGSFDTYLSKARVNGWVNTEGDRIQVTDDGLNALGTFEPLPEGQALLQHYIAEFGNSGAARMLRVIADAYPRPLSRAEISEAATVSAAGGSFDTYLSKLRTLELVEGRSEIKASDEFFQEG